MLIELFLGFNLDVKQIFCWIKICCFL